MTIFTRWWTMSIQWTKIKNISTWFKELSQERILNFQKTPPPTITNPMEDIYCQPTPRTDKRGSSLSSNSYINVLNVWFQSLKCKRAHLVNDKKYEKEAINLLFCFVLLFFCFFFMQNKLLLMQYFSEDNYETSFDENLCESP